MTKHSQRFFRNTDCPYFPCHQGADPETFNCLFCYCPLYLLGEECGGDFTMTPAGVKDCTGCLKPHAPGGYEYVLAVLKEKVFAPDRGKGMNSKTNHSG